MKKFTFIFILLSFYSNSVHAQLEFIPPKFYQLEHFKIPLPGIASYFDEVMLDSFIQETMTNHHIVGLSACVLNEGQLMWKKPYGYSNLSHSRLVTDSTLFLQASISKTFVATAIMQLWEDGLFGLDDNINNYLPSNLQVHNPLYPNGIITFKRLLNHKSSIKDNWNVLFALETPGDSPIPLNEFLIDYLIPGGTHYNANENFCNWAPHGYPA